MGANPDVSVTLATRRPDLWSTHVHAVHNGLVVIGRLAAVTADSAVAVSGADLVLVAAPAFAHREIMAGIRPFLAPHAWVGALPAPGFFDWAAHSVLGPQARIFGGQRSPYNCRITIPGREVEILGVVPSLGVAAAPRRDFGNLAELLGTALSLRIELLDHFLCATLAPSASIFHPARLFAVFCDWDGYTPFRKVPLFYEEWDDGASKVYLHCDAELHAVCDAVPLDMSGIAPIRDHYGVSTAAALTARIRSLPGLRGISIPMRAVGHGYVPDLRSRFFTEDFPFGLGAVRVLAALVGVKTPLLDVIHAWSRRPPILPEHNSPAADCSERVRGRSLEDLIRIATR
jgi:opine dehydrogenase